MILSLDVAWRNTGYIVFDKGEPVAAGVIRTEAPKKKSSVRVSDYNSMLAADIARTLKGLIQKYGVKGVVGELPTGGALSAKSMQQMGMAVAVVSAALELLGVPAEWVTPNDVKLAATGLRSASKEDMMAAASSEFGFKCDGKKFTIPGCGKFTKGDFEHIADAAFVFKAADGGNIRKIFG